MGKSLSGSANSMAKHQKENILNPNALREEAKLSPLEKFLAGSSSRSEKAEESNLDIRKIDCLVEQSKSFALWKSISGSAQTAKQQKDVSRTEAWNDWGQILFFGKI